MVIISKGLTDAEFERRYGTEELCEAALFAAKWPGGFVCPHCKVVRGYWTRPNRNMRCAECRHDTSLLAGTIFQDAKLPLTLWFRAMHLVTATKQGVSAMEIARRLGISYNSAWLMRRKIREAMREDERDSGIGGGGGSGCDRVELDDAYLGGERNGGGCGRGSPAKIPFVAAVEVLTGGAMGRIRLQVVSGFRTEQIEAFRDAFVRPGTICRSDGLACFRGLADAGNGIVHIPTVSRTRRPNPGRMSVFWSVNTALSNLKTALAATHKSVGVRHAPTALAAFQWIFNRRRELDRIVANLASALVRTAPLTRVACHARESCW